MSLFFGLDDVDKWIEVTSAVKRSVIPSEDQYGEMLLFNRLSCDPVRKRKTTVTGR